MASAEGDEPAKRRKGSVFELIGQWQIVVTLIAAATGVWFGLEERDQKRLAINQEALKFVRGAAVTERFWADPPNTINEIEASYPRHAFCATLGYLLAEVSRADLRRSVPGGEGADRSATLNSARSTIDEEVARIADEAGMPICYLREVAQATAKQAIPQTWSGGTSSRTIPDTRPAMCRDVEAAGQCAGIKARTHWLDRQLLPRECLLVLDAYGENACVVESEVRRQSFLVMQKQEEARRLAEAARAQAAPQQQQTQQQQTQQQQQLPMPMPPPGQGGEQTGGDQGEQPGEQAVLAPSSEPQGPGPCGKEPPAVFTQFPVGGGATARAVAEALGAAGWSMTPLDEVKAAPAGGEVRYYYPEQQGCAEALAEDTARALRRAGFATAGLKVISLAGVYRNLPRGRIELWLPSP